MFGLFAPVHKVTRLTSGNITNSMSASTPSPQSRSLMNTSLRLSRERSGSQDSVSSISSTASSVSRSRVRLGVNSLSSNQVHAVLLMLSKAKDHPLCVHFSQTLAKFKSRLDILTDFHRLVLKLSRSASWFTLHFWHKLSILCCFAWYHSFSQGTWKQYFSSLF